MLEMNELLQLMKATAKADRSAPVAYSFNGENLSYDALNETLRTELNEYAGTWAQYRENKNKIFSLIEQTMDDILPRKVQEEYGKFAEVKTMKQGDKAVFMRSHDRERAKQFITKVGLAGIYEVFKLGKDTPIEVQTSAIGGAAQIGLEEFLDGRADFAEVTRIVMEGLDELVYWEIGQALKTGLNQLPALNTAAVAGFDEQAFDRLIAISAAYAHLLSIAPRNLHRLLSQLTLMLGLTICVIPFGTMAVLLLTRIIQSPFFHRASPMQLMRRRLSILVIATFFLAL